MTKHSVTEGGNMAHFSVRDRGGNGRPWEVVNEKGERQSLHKTFDLAVKAAEKYQNWRNKFATKERG